MSEDAHAKESFRQAMWDAWYDWLATDDAGIPSKAEQCVQFFAKRGWQELAALRQQLAECMSVVEIMAQDKCTTGADPDCPCGVCQANRILRRQP